MYTWFERTSPHPMLMTFDAPEGILCTMRRERSNTPLQALTLLNDTAFVEIALRVGATCPSRGPRRQGPIGTGVSAVRVTKTDRTRIVAIEGSALRTPRGV
jgi:hypothetical protein